MIEVNRLHNSGSIVINADLIETIEACPDTHITLVNRRMFVVAEGRDEVVAKVMDYRRRVASLAVASSMPLIDEAA